MKPKPTLSTAPLDVEEELQQRWWSSILSTKKYGRVQQSVFDKWNFRTKPTSMPTLLCDIHDNFKRVDTRLDEVPVGSDYVALSYTWGEWMSKDKELRSEILEVAKEIGIQYAWVDAWCIDEDMKENEIPRMGEYYAGASAVIVLLSDVEERTAYTNLTHGAPFDLRKARVDDAALGRAIVKSTWRSRVWTLQEGLLAQNCIVKTRHQILDGEYLDHLLHFPEHCKDSQWASLGHTHSMHSPVSNVRGFWKNDALKAYSCTFGNTLWWHSGAQSAVSGANRASFLEVLKIGVGRQCKEPLDSVIGLLGLVDGPSPPPISAKTAQWDSLWATLVQSGIVGIDVLRIARACQEKGISWAPARITDTMPPEIVGIDGEMHAQTLEITDDGLQVMGTPVEVIVGEKNAKDTLHQDFEQRDITIVVNHGNDIKTTGQVYADTGDKFVGIVLESQSGDKGVTVLLGKWKDCTENMRIFQRYTSANVVKVLKLVRAVESAQQVQITIGL